jgi:hypothetical protein
MDYDPVTMTIRYREDIRRALQLAEHLEGWAAAQDQCVAAARASETHRVRVKFKVSPRKLAEEMRNVTA